MKVAPVRRLKCWKSSKRLTNKSSGVADLKNNL